MIPRNRNFRRPQAKPPPPVKIKKPVHICGHGPNLSEPCRACFRGQSRRRIKALRTRTNERLPDNAVFHAEYDAGIVLWTGTLTIGEVVYEAKAHGVHHLLKRLGQIHREAVNPQHETEGTGNGNGQQESGNGQERPPAVGTATA
jgi:hypothetical protein